MPTLLPWWLWIEETSINILSYWLTQLGNDPLYTIIPGHHYFLWRAGDEVLCNLVYSYTVLKYSWFLFITSFVGGCKMYIVEH